VRIFYEEAGKPGKPFLKSPLSWLPGFLMACCLALVSGCEGGGASGAPGRDEALAGIAALDGVKSPSPEERARLRALCESFVERHAADPEAPQVRRRLGVLLASEGDDDGAARELRLVTPTAAPGTPFRTVALYTLGQVETRRGALLEARAALAAVVAEAPESEAGRAAKQDLLDLAKVGGPAAGTVIAGDDPRLLARRGDAGTGTSAEARSATGAPWVVAVVKAGEAPPAELPTDATVINVRGWDDPHVATFRPPALPRVYVIDAAGVVRAAGVRKAGLEKALREAQGPR